MKIGDIVRLNSGGPEMTISCVEEDCGDLDITCEWHSDTGGILTHVFASECLTHVPPSPGVKVTKWSTTPSEGATDGPAPIS